MFFLCCGDFCVVELLNTDSCMFQKRVICIHAVSSQAMSVEHFERYVVSMQKIGFRFVPLSEILQESCRGKFLALTVDDAYKACIVNLLPILERYGIVATLFVPTGLMGLSSNHEELIQNGCYPNEETMLVEDLRLWMSKGQQVGFHTYKHIDLRKSTKKVIVQDFQMGMKKLREWGIETNVFAYPFGYLPVDRLHFEQELYSSGFKYAFTVRWGDVNLTTPYYINRVCIGDKEPLLWSMLKTIGCVDWYYKLKNEK